MISSADDAARAVRAVKYPPRGARGVGLGRAQKYGPGFAEYVLRSDELIVIAQIEHIDAVQNLEAILEVEGIDGTMIGPYDLSASLGVPGEFDHPLVVSALAKYESICRERSKPMGYHVISPERTLLEQKVASGYTCLAFSVDFLFLGSCRTEMAAFRANATSAPMRSRSIAG